MRPKTAERAVQVYLRRFAPPRPHVRFFGGEPLLEFSLLRRVVEGFPRGGAREPSFSFPTNGTLLDGEALSFLRAHPEVEAAVSRPPSRAVARGLAALPNVLVNVCVPPREAAGLPRRVAGLLKAGFSRLNILPAFYVEWSEPQLRALERSLRVSAGLLSEWRRQGRPLEVRNLTVSNPTPLFNHGMVVDVDGEAYASNAALCAPFYRRRKELRLGSVLRGRLDWGRARAVRYDELFRECLSPAAYESTARVNSLLTDFVHELS
jgi:hypothetical protein